MMGKEGGEGELLYCRVLVRQGCSWLTLVTPLPEVPSKGQRCDALHVQYMYRRVVSRPRYGYGYGQSRTSKYTIQYMYGWI